MEDETVETATDGISLGKKEVLQTEVQHLAARLSRRLWERRHFAEFHSIPYPGGDLWQLGWELGLLCCFSWLDFSRRTFWSPAGALRAVGCWAPRSHFDPRAVADRDLGWLEKIWAGWCARVLHWLC